ncbi:Eukaryotic translation initiation factor 3 subunit M [Phytophthora boehmeriae]|uniref:Eukaryotic translation initiation factor 3 subunit M n=1 Tax=Phytophthora boehmeriae TaxID=109152 RepID=A0A8T1X7V9_9STRA|nr:Eukaryotic translation initiation factor 3 subunit M [Phytophthora boehmeriae]
MASDLVDYVTKLLPGAAPADLSVDIKKREFAPVVAAIAPKAPQLLALEAETDVEGAFALLWDVVLQLPAAQAETEALKLLKTVADSQAGAVFRLRIAANLFNKAKTLPKVRLQALLTVLDLAATSNNGELVAPYLEQMETLVNAQKISVEDRRVLLLKVADLLSKSQDNLKVLAVLEKYLATFEQDKAAEAKATAERAAKLVLQNPVASFLARVNLITSPVVAAALKGTKLYELLDVVSTKTLKEFVAFQKNAGDVFTKYELKQEELADTMRLFTLCSLPTGFKEIPYAEVAAVLDLQEEDVEKWVVRAITSGLVSAKINQLSRTVVISRTLQRGFGVEQWKEIDAKLQLYKKNVGGLLDVIKNARRAQEQQ